MNILVSIEEAAEQLSLSPWTIRLYIRTGKINRVNVGRRVLIEASELERFVGECKQETPSISKQ